MLALPDEVFITGRMGSGKDYIGKLLTAAGFTRLPFALAVREEVAAIYGVTVEEIEANKAAWRTALQAVGHSYRQQYGEDHWLRVWATKRNEIDGPVVVTDCRYFNEAFLGLQRGALVVRVKTPEDVRMQRLIGLYGGVTEEQLNHPSETDVDLLPVHLELSGTMATNDIVPTLEAVYRAMLQFLNPATPVQEVTD